MHHRFTLTSAEIQTLPDRFTWLVGNDEASTLGHLRLTARGGRRRWYATDSYVAGILEVGHEGPDCDILISPRILPSQTHEGSLWELSVPRPLGDGTFTGPALLRVDAMEVTQPVRYPSFPDLDTIHGDARAEPAATARVSRHTLAELLNISRRRPAGSPEQLSPPAFLTIGDGQVSVHAEWAGWGESRVTVDSEDCSGRATAAVGLHLLQRLVEASPADLTLRVPIERGRPICVEGGPFFGLLMPRVWPDAAARLSEVQEILARDLGIDFVEPDADGDLPVPSEDVPIYIRTVDNSDADVQVFTVLAQAQADDPGLLSRINEINSVVRGCRLFAIDGQVLLESDLPGNELSADSLALHFLGVDLPHGSSAQSRPVSQPHGCPLPRGYAELRIEGGEPALRSRRGWTCQIGWCLHARLSQQVEGRFAGLVELVGLGAGQAPCRFAAGGVGNGRQRPGL